MHWRPYACRVVCVVRCACCELCVCASCELCVVRRVSCAVCVVRCVFKRAECNDVTWYTHGNLNCPLHVFSRRCNVGGEGGGEGGEGDGGGGERWRMERRAEGAPGTGTVYGLVCVCARTWWWWWRTHAHVCAGGETLQFLLHRHRHPTAHAVPR